MKFRVDWAGDFSWIVIVRVMAMGVMLGKEYGMKIEERHKELQHLTWCWASKALVELF